MKILGIIFQALLVVIAVVGSIALPAAMYGGAWAIGFMVGKIINLFIYGPEWFPAALATVPTTLWFLRSARVAWREDTNEQ